MVSRYKTGELSEALLASEQILALAREILPREKYAEADRLSRMLIGTKSEKKSAQLRLIELIKPPPKRPLYYCQHEVLFLPRWTRDVLRDLGEFITILLKEAIFEKTLNRKVYTYSLGPAINSFRRCHPFESQLLNWLERYNRFLYRPAKHDMTLPKGRKEHRFTSREVVLTAFVTMELADRITNLSPRALKARRDELFESNGYG